MRGDVHQAIPANGDLEIESPVVVDARLPEIVDAAVFLACNEG
jgi:hypothetical protein